ncbi:MAG: PhzF family phenazine biosynthesis protein [Roseibium album]|uniref:PhzF family phenazine biosynthesis protein n=1 Tax=Roseibium album TaxID=311410 RepID=UPI000CF0B419|nr:PhzF family phenazine biosynthesis protein [Roseibium album]MBG6144966.1 trans-2,3-dihydro-3-hydroxyanthranilate isomerase [Labrenzia sp. EL_142]MBG6155719.1 trans-2,3-dihydro-3-hydroxyanthranilate isomerase [Labrenzia sp. EL_162]MBG6161172.1 trans-2,3-dihydro-3-hydroxyanthranilate isomerase [Labrenzia sp. EL_195]MBG6173129.1 trans-2,3-dihydro-3-hydroxyanthranilate isomerase [Labrenzia sp. EL_132]MBG6194253.1 trans-2,3-dihydro-3-hydroxyanthranilate isomerase [Labrenzia sp. EL_159]MBG620317
MGRRYAILDVFTNTLLAGNPLAVVLDSEDLSDEQMQKIAAEFNLSETVFVFPPENPGHSASLRIFTPKVELPFAGHPTVGTAILLATERFGDVNGEQDAVVVLKQKIGTVRCAVILRENAAAFAEFDVPNLPEPAGPTHNVELIAAALDLEPTDIGFENHAPSRFKVGPPFSFVPVRDLDALSRAKPVAAMWKAGFGKDDHNDAYVYCRETRSHDSAFHARLFAPEMGIPEDPATGSAAAAFAGVVHFYDGLTAGTHHIRIEQGFEMGRPSLIDLEIDVENGGMHAVRIGGQATLVARGELFV